MLADYARRNPDRLTWIEIGDELLVHLRVLNGHDTDLASDANRTINRCRNALLAVSPALERILGHRLTQPGIRDLLAKWPTPTALNTAGRTKIRNAIGKRSPRLATHPHHPHPHRHRNSNSDLVRRNHLGRSHHQPHRRPGTNPNPPWETDRQDPKKRSSTIPSDKC